VSTRDDLILAIEGGQLLDAVHERVMSRDEPTTLAAELVALHNEGQVDLVATFAPLGERLDGPAFFMTRHVFEQALPDLDAPVPAVIGCVLRLYQGAGHDLAAGSIVRSYMEYLQRSQGNAAEALAEIEAKPDTLAELLPATLIAGFHTDRELFAREAMRLCQDTSLDLRRQALYSIGRLEWASGEEAMLALTTLERSAEVEGDDLCLAAIMKSAFALMLKDGALEARVVGLIKSALEAGDEQAIHAASEIFGFDTDKMTPSVFDVIRPFLIQVKLVNKGTVDNVDFGLAHLLERGDSSIAVRLLEELLMSDGWSMGLLDGAARAILLNPSLMSWVASRWLMRGDRPLCTAVGTIVASSGGDPGLNADCAELEDADPFRLVFAARKAIGYLFGHPMSACSFLISVMECAKADKRVLEGLAQLLFDPLLLNYTGRAREYVMAGQEAASDEVKWAVSLALERLEDYLAALRSVGDLPALHPGARQQGAYDRQLSRQMQESWKAAEASSPILSLISKSVVLYGRTSVMYSHEGAGTPARTEFPMQRHETEMELPRMLRLDPIGLEYMLRVFRVERIAT